MDGLLILARRPRRVEVLGLPVLVVLYLSERSRVAQQSSALTLEVARLRSALAGTGAPRCRSPHLVAVTSHRRRRQPGTVAAHAAPSRRSASRPGAGRACRRAPAVPRESLEERVMRRWAVWLGAVALVFGAYFLVKFSIEQGWFGPAARVGAGAVLGLALVGAQRMGAPARHPFAAAGRRARRDPAGARRRGLGRPSSRASTPRTRSIIS